MWDVDGMITSPQYWQVRRLHNPVSNGLFEKYSTCVVYTSLPCDLAPLFVPRTCSNTAICSIKNTSYSTVNRYIVTVDNNL